MDDSGQKGGVGFIGLLALLFIALKLTGFIGWSWWWVLAPLWIPLFLLLMVAIICLLVALFFELRGYGLLSKKVKPLAWTDSLRS